MFKEREEGNDNTQNIIDRIKNKYRSFNSKKEHEENSERVNPQTEENKPLQFNKTPKNAEAGNAPKAEKPKPAHKHKEDNRKVHHKQIFPHGHVHNNEWTLIKENEAVKKKEKPKFEKGKWHGHENRKPAPKKRELIPHGDPFVYRKRMKNPKKFPFVKPQDAFFKTYPFARNKAQKTRKGVVRVLAFGWLEQVWINCMWFEYNNQVLIVDMGLQFPDAYSNWISFRVPDLSYLKNKKVVWIAITHGHIDHIWGIPHLIRQFGKWVPIFATPMAYELIRMKQKQFGYMPNVIEYNRDKMVAAGDYFSMIPFVVDHSIPDSIGLMINTPNGRIVHTWDWKFDQTPPEFRPSVNYKTLESFGKMGVKMLLSDSTNAFMPWSSISEKEVITPLEDIFAGANGRVITATFASIIDRIALIINISEKFGRKVVLLWKGMNDYMTIAKKLGYVRHKPDTLITMEEADNLPDDKVTICCTWAQGERYAALMRIATWESRDTSFKEGDTVIFSSSVIPWNERSVQELFGLCLEAKTTIHHYRSTNIHAWGHARNEDVKKMLELIQPEYFMPIYGERYMLHENAKIAISQGFEEDKVIVWRNWETFEINEEGKVEKSGFIRANYITVDGGLVWMTKEKEIHEREQMKDSGILIISISKTSKWSFVGIETVGLPDFENSLKYLKDKVNNEVKALVQRDKWFFKDIAKSTRHVEKRIWNLVYQEIEKEPIVKVIVNSWNSK